MIKALEKRLAWIYDFWTSLAPYAYARAEDNVVIVPPNLVYKSNPTGIALLEYVKAGGRFKDIPGFDEQKANEIESFFLTLKKVCNGERISLDKVAYDTSFTKLPILGEIAITYRCNNICRFCYAGCGDPSGLAMAQSDGREELDTAAWKRIIDSFKNEAKIPFFSFTGGEPLIRRDVEDLAAYAVSLGMRVNF